MTKAEEIAARYKTPPYWKSEQAIILAVDEVLEWTAQQCESVEREYRQKQHMGPSLGASICAKRIRAGKSK